MSENDNREESLSCKSACGEIPWKPARSTLAGYLHDGVKNSHTGERVYLNFDQDGGRIVIKRSYITEFIAAINRRPGEEAASV